MDNQLEKKRANSIDTRIIDWFVVVRAKGHPRYMVLYPSTI